MDCEPFASEHVKPGWICCICSYYNKWDRGRCLECLHQLCLISPTPIRITKTGKQLLHQELTQVFKKTGKNVTPLNRLNLPIKRFYKK